MAAAAAAEATAMPTVTKAPGGAVRFTVLGLRRGGKDATHTLYPFLVSLGGVERRVEMVRVCVCVF